MPKTRRAGRKHELQKLVRELYESAVINRYPLGIVEPLRVIGDTRIVTPVIEKMESLDTTGVSEIHTVASSLIPRKL